ncbi:SAVED domain-containing protein [Faecalibaculum rodentium]|uniref:SAVED domain-containing protein n=1 Tax=Faecalibaculum rodentium TaxID=1702221 RepID=UPI0023F0C255|nr:SAVED domain-containing protein [Faecalibaculum rodentium]
MAVGRQGSIQSKTRELLIARAAGRCEFEGCNRILDIDTVTQETNKGWEVAHICAASHNGPRGDETKTSDELNNIDNLMALCKDHHKLIDENPEHYPAERLRDMKRSHEEKVKQILDTMSLPASRMVFLESEINGRNFTCINEQVARQAVASNCLYCRPESPIKIRPKNNSFEHTEEYCFQAEANYLLSKAKENIKEEVDDDRKMVLSVFPFAPIPIIALFGEILSSYPCHVYQLKQPHGNWTWPSKEIFNQYRITWIDNRKDSFNEAGVLIISISGEIDTTRIPEEFQNSVYCLVRAEEIGGNVIKSEQDLKLFSKNYQMVCDQFLNTYHVKKIALFAAVPVSVAFEIGYAYKAGTYPPMDIYELRGEYIKGVRMG